MNMTRMNAKALERRLLIAVIVVASLWFSVACRPTNVQLVHESVSQPLGLATRANKAQSTSPNSMSRILISKAALGTPP